MFDLLAVIAQLRTYHDLKNSTLFETFITISEMMVIDYRLDFVHNEKLEFIDIIK